jgi:folate-binding protein YgfZ
MIPEKSNLMESNIDTLNGISFEKGCYIGQELTARMNYRALVKKRLKTVKISALPEGAELRSHVDDIGIALVKD